MTRFAWASRKSFFAPKAAPDTVPSDGPSSIIYVEDNWGDAELFRRALLQMRPEVNLIQFRDGYSAQSFLATGERPELIAVDINLPGIGGMELIHWIRQQEGMSATPVIALSGSSEALNAVQEPEEMGASLFLLKPGDYDGWIDLVYQIEDFLPPT